eukprot:ctg_1316.g494
MAFVTLTAPVGTHRFPPQNRPLRLARGPRCAPAPSRSRGGVARIVATDSAAAKGKGATEGATPVSTQYDPMPLHTALMPPKTDLKRVRQMLNDHASGKLALDLHVVDAHRRTALHVATGLGMPDIPGADAAAHGQRVRPTEHRRGAAARCRGPDRYVVAGYAEPNGVGVGTDVSAQRAAAQVYRAGAESETQRVHAGGRAAVQLFAALCRRG